MRIRSVELRVIRCYACDLELINCELIIFVFKHELSWIIRKLCHELIWSNLSIDFLSFLFIICHYHATFAQFPSKSHQPNAHSSFQFLFLFIRKLRVFDVIFHTFNCRLLELIKIQTLNLTGYELLGYLGIKITFKVNFAYGL